MRQPAPGGKENSLGLPLRALFGDLSPELKFRVQITEIDTPIPIALATLLPQLARGVVKIRFGELRQAAPQAFTPQADLDQAWVTLPLGEIVARLDPASVQRQRRQKRVAIPEDMPAPFDFPGAPSAASHELPAVKPAPRSQPEEAAMPEPLPPRPPATRPESPAEPPRQNTIPSAPPVPPGQVTFHPFPRPQRAPAAQRESTAIPRVTPSPMRMASSVAPPVPVLVPPDETPVAPVTFNGSALRINLAELLPGWPDAIQQEAAQLGLTGTALALPLDVAKQGLKRGQLSYSWKTIRGWISPAVPQAISANDAAGLSLPLKIVAPAFLAIQGKAAQKQKFAVDESIPDLFQVAVPSAPTPAAPAVTAVPELLPAAPATAPTPEEPAVAKTVLTPDQIVLQATALKGVGGALVTLTEGFPVATRLPEGVSPEALAGFIPQVYGKVTESVREFQIGELTRLRFNVGEVPWEIIRVREAFFAAFGRAGEPFPEEQLAALATHLNRTN